MYRVEEAAVRMNRNPRRVCRLRRQPERRDLSGLGVVLVAINPLALASLLRVGAHEQNVLAFLGGTGGGENRQGREHREQRENADKILTYFHDLYENPEWGVSASGRATARICWCARSGEVRVDLRHRCAELSSLCGRTIRHEHSYVRCESLSDSGLGQGARDLGTRECPLASGGYEAH